MVPSRSKLQVVTSSNHKVASSKSPPLRGIFHFWHERSALQSVAVRRSTGIDVSGPLFWHKRCQAVRRCRRWAIAPGAARLVFTIIFFPPFFSVATFSHRRGARIKKLILQKWLEMPNNLGLIPFPDPVSHFLAPWRPFWILQAILCFS